MSSILKALKKLETQADGSEGNTAAGAMDARRALRRRIRTPRRIWPWAVVLIVFCGVGTGLFFRKSVLESALPAPLLSSSPRKPPSSKRLVVPSLADSEKTAPAIAPKTLSPMRPEAKPMQAVTGGAAKTTASKDRAGRKAIHAAVHSRKEMLSPPIPVTDVELPVLPPQKTVSPAPVALPPLPADTGLKLQALAWAADAKSRFVVINSKILREGERIDDITVERIDQEKVVLRKDGRLWRLGHRPQR